MSEKKTKVKVNHLTKKFGDLLVLNDMSFDVEDGDLLCVVGPTGCGKTTFLNSLTKIYDITDGEILLNGEQVRFGLDIKKIPEARKKEQVDKYLEIVGLSKYRKYYPKQLSASMLQRVSIARAFATEPELLLMDEPYGQLDIELRFKLEDELVKLWQMTGTTVLFITHNIEEAVYLGNKIMVLTNKPTTVKKTLINELPRPRDIAAPEFVKLRNEVTELIKWW